MEADEAAGKRVEVARDAAVAAVTRASMTDKALAKPVLSMPTGESPEDDLKIAAKYIWFVLQLRPMQLEALLHLFSKENAVKKLICIQPTGRGKSLIIKLLCTMLRGVHLIVHPLLVLTADQVASFQRGSQDHGTIVVINLDQQASRSRTFLDAIIKLITSLPKLTSSTVILFGSPQFFCNNLHFIDALFQCNNNRLLRSVVIDEYHLFAQHGGSFRPEIRMFSDIFIRRIFNMSPRERPFFVALTATMSLNDLGAGSAITRVGFPQRYRYWAEADDFDQPNTTLIHRVGSDFTKNLDRVVKHFQTTQSAAFIFANSRRLTVNLRKALEEKLDEKRDWL